MDSTHVLSEIRTACQKKGATGVKELGQIFGIYGCDRKNMLSFDEFEKGLVRYGCDLTTDEISALFDEFDRGGEGSIDIEELFRKIRPGMSSYRDKLVRRVFNMIDVNSRGTITVSEIRTSFDVKTHPRYLSGEMSAREVFLSFLKDFDADENSDVTLDEWLDYYAGVSETIEKDVCFDFMMRQHWRL